MGKIATVVGIAIKRESRASMEVFQSRYISLQNGLEDDHKGRRTLINTGRRQITVISLEQWDEVCAELGIDLPWHTRRANICVSGRVFGPSDVFDKNRILIFSNDPILEITGETKPCSRMDEIHPGLRDALSKNWRGGVTCRVVNGGPIQVGDIVNC